MQVIRRAREEWWCHVGTDVMSVTGKAVTFSDKCCVEAVLYS